MARRRESVFDSLLVLPWWVSILFAVVAYLGLAHVVPLFMGDHPLIAGVAGGLKTVAPFFAGAFVLAGVGSLIRSLVIARKFDNQKSLDDIRALSWRQFESIVGEAFRRRGYLVVENAVDGADGGIDLVLRKDGQRYLVQCKQWKQLKVGVKPVRELFGVISAEGADGGFFVASGTYTEEARQFATTTSIDLIDGPELERMIQDARSVEPFMDPTAISARPTTTWSIGSAAPDCPRCGSPMVGRTAKRGTNAGSQFWGCSQFPRCKGTKAIAGISPI